MKYGDDDRTDGDDRSSDRSDSGDLPRDPAVAALMREVEAILSRNPGFDLGRGSWGYQKGAEPAEVRSGCHRVTFLYDDEREVVVDFPPDAFEDLDEVMGYAREHFPDHLGESE